MVCYSFLEYWVNLVGDYNPTNKEIHLEPMHIADVYNEYELEYRGSQFLVSLKAFYWKWANLFPHVKIRQFKAVTGK